MARFVLSEERAGAWPIKGSIGFSPFGTSTWVMRWQSNRPRLRWDARFDSLAVARRYGKQPHALGASTGFVRSRTSGRGGAPRLSVAGQKFGEPSRALRSDSPRNTRRYRREHPEYLEDGL